MLGFGFDNADDATAFAEQRVIGKSVSGFLEITAEFVTASFRQFDVLL